MSYSPKKILKKTFAWFLRVLGILVLLLLVVWALLQTQWGKNLVKDKAVNYLRNKLKTNVSVDGITVEWFSHIRLNGVYIEDLQKRKLLGIGELDVHYDITDIFSNKLDIPEVKVKELEVNLYRSRTDSSFNFSFIPAAFSTAGETESQDTTSGNAFVMGLGKISLTKLKFLMDDQYGGQVYRVSFDSLHTEIDEFDLNALQFHLKTLHTDSLSCVMQLFAPYITTVAKKEETSSGPSSFLLGIDSAQLLHTSFSMQNPETKMDIRSNAGLLGGSKIAYNQANMHVDADYLTLRDHSTSVQIKSVNTVDSSVADTSKPFTYFAKHADIETGNVVFNDLAYPETGGRQVDYRHLDFKNIQVHADSTGYDGSHYFLNVKQMTAVEKCGFNLQQLSASVQYADSVVMLNGIVLKTPYNQLQGDGYISYPSIEAITTNPASTNIRLNIRKSSLQLDELLYFNAALEKNASFKPLLGKQFLINTTVNGTLDRLSIPSLLIQQSQTRIQASALVNHAMDANRLSIDLTLKEFTGNRKDLLALLPPKTIPDSLLHYIPETFSVKGNFKGGMNDFYTDLQLQSSEGNASIKGTAKNITDKKNAVYDMALATNNLNLARLMNDTTFGNLSATVKLKGKGYDPETMNTDYDVKLDEATYNGYNYKDVSLKGNIANKKLEAHLRSNDPNIQLESDTYYDMSRTGGNFKTNTNIGNINLYRLGFMNDTMSISGKINADFPVLDTTTLKGTANIAGLIINYQNRKYAFDSIFITADHIADTQTIALKTSFADATLKGKYTLTNIGPAITKVTNRYLYTATADSIYTGRVNAVLNMNVYLPDSMAGIIPGLRSIEPFNTVATINTDSSLITFNSVLPRVKYQDYKIDSIHLFALNKPSSTGFHDLTFGLVVQQVTSPSFTLPESSLGGTMLQGRIKGKLELLDDDKKLRYTIPFAVVNDPARPYVSIPDSLYINRRKWAVNNDNIIYLSADELKGTNLTISNGLESLKIMAEGTDASGLPLTLRLNKFRLRNVSELVVFDTAFLWGEANGYFSVTSFKDFSFVSDLVVDSLRIKQVLAGTLTIKVKQQEDEKLAIDMSLIGNGNKVTLTGSYNLRESAPYLSLDMMPLNMEIAEPLVSSYLGRLRGRIQGSIDIHGTLDKPDITGAILLDSLQAVYKDYNTFIQVPSSGINFEKGAINFSPLYFTDSAGNKATLTGDIFTDDYKDYRFDLRLRATHFLAVGIKRFPDQAAYGPTYTNAFINISGNMKKIEFNGSVNVVDTSEFTYIYRPDETAPLGEGLMEFFDPAHPDDTLILKKKKEAASSPLQLAMNVYINIKPETSVTIMLDELTGDHLTIYGTANLNMTMSPGGQMYLTGSYIAEKGSYDLSIAQIIRKKFQIQKGSTITWTGDPLKAAMNITAVYNIKTSAGELVTDQQSVPGIDKQQMNFEVYLILTKEMLNPQISFRIDMDEADQQLFNGIVYTRIKQINAIEAELNKQVMGLLAINHFIADNPFSSLSGGSGTSFETKAYATAGRLLTQELTELVGNAIKGVDINFGLDVNENYTSGTAQRNTNLKIGISKSLANNRLIVYVGSSFALEGQNQNATALDGLAGDVTLEYLLTKDGKYRLKAYRINQTELTFEAAIIKTGVSFVVVLEFNKFQNLFKKKKNRNKS